MGRPNDDRITMMKKITVILEADEDGTIRLPVPPELRRGKVEVSATLRPANGLRRQPEVASASMLAQRKAALARLRELGGLKSVIPDPVAWQRDLRTDRPLPGRE
jgi:hypothetical protein